MRKIIIIFMILVLTSCNSKQEENEQEVQTGGIIDDTINTVDSYGETIKDTIDGAKDIKNVIDDRYKDFESNIPR